MNLILKPTRTHDLKCWPEYFEKILAGNKHFELRKNDRNFQEGDQLILREWDPQTKDYTGRTDVFLIGYILGLQRYLSLETDYYILSLKNPTEHYGKIVFDNEGVNNFETFKTAEEAKAYVMGFEAAKAISEESDEDPLSDYHAGSDQIYPTDEN